MKLDLEFDLGNSPSRCDTTSEKLFTKIGNREIENLESSPIGNALGVNLTK